MTLLLTCELADDRPNVDPTSWVDHTVSLRTPDVGGQLLHAGRGRDDEMTVVDAGTATIQLDNADRTYDPRVGTIRPWTHVRLRLAHDGGTIPIFRGFVEGIDQHHEDAADRYASVRLVDALKWCASRPVQLVRPRELSGARIAAVLDAAGWPATLRDLDPGHVEVDPLDEDTGDDVALALIRDAVTAEDGTYEAAADGKLTFRDRHARLDLEPAATIETTGYREITGAFDDDLLVNVAKVELADGRIARHADPDSIAVYDERQWGATDLPVKPVEAEAAGMWAVYRYSQLHERIAPVAFTAVDPAGGLLERQIGDLVELRRRWPNGDIDVLDLVVEKITHTVTAARWSLTWALSPWWGGADWLVVADTAEDDVPGLDEGVAAP